MCHWKQNLKTLCPLQHWSNACLTCSCHFLQSVIPSVVQQNNVRCLIKSIRTSLCSSKLKPRCQYNCTYWYKRRQKTVCCSLLSSTSSIGSSRELSDFERELVATSVRNLSGTLQLYSSYPSRRLVTWLWRGNVKAQPQTNDWVDHV
jgi:hypothetical protein